MKRFIVVAIFSSLLVLPSVRLWADYDNKESAESEKTESREHQLAEEKEAMEHYNKAVTKHGQDSSQAKKAWKHVVAEYKEHGDTPPTPDAAVPTQPK